MVTWESERERAPERCVQLESAGVELIIRPDCAVRGIGNIWPQMLAMDIGLGVLGDSSVFKTRADLWIDPAVLEAVASTPGYLDRGSPSISGVFNQRVWLPWFEITTPFYYSDECFFGSASDLRRLINYDESYSLLFKPACGVTHYRRFVHPFRGLSPATELFLERYTDTGIGSDRRWEKLAGLLEDGGYLESVAASYAVLGSCFRVGCPDGSIEFRSWSSGTPSPGSGALASCFAPEGQGLESGHLFCHDDRWLHSVLAGELPPDPLGARMSAALEAVRSHGLDWCKPTGWISQGPASVPS